MWNDFSKSATRKLWLLGATGLSTLGFITLAQAADPGAQPTESNLRASQPLKLPDGFFEKDEDAVSGIKTTLVQITNRAVTKDSYDSFFSGFLSDLARRDKERAREFKGADQNRLNDLISQIQTKWHARYNQDFDVSDKNVTFDTRFPIVQGEVSDPTLAISSWPVASSAGQAVTASSNTQQQESNSKELTKGRPVSIIRFPAGDGMPEMNVSFIHQHVTGWYVDLPVDRTGEQIYNDLVAHLNYIASHEGEWPTDVNDGYRMVTRNIVAALYGVPAPTGTASAQ